MKNPFENFKQSTLGLWKKPVPASSTTQALPDSCEPQAPAPKLFPSSVVKDFLEILARQDHPSVLDLGPVVGSNIELFFYNGFKLHVEDLLEAYFRPAYWNSVEGQLVLDQRKFLSENLNYRDNCFDGVICWDLLDFLDPKAAKSIVERISVVMKPNGLLLAFFHAHKTQGPISRCKYRLHSEMKLEHIPLDSQRDVKKTYQTRDITQLFTGFQNLKFYLMKHNLLEVLFRKG